MSLPTRSATSRHKSFSMRPVGPMVPVSCPPCPASMTMRPIFKPRARDKDCWPSRGVSGMEAGPISSAWSCADFRLRADLVFGEAGRAVGGGGATLWPAPATGKDADCTTRYVGAGLSIADGITADLDAMFLLALVESISRWGWGIRE